MFSDTRYGITGSVNTIAITFNTRRTLEQVLVRMKNARNKITSRFVMKSIHAFKTIQFSTRLVVGREMLSNGLSSYLSLSLSPSPTHTHTHTHTIIVVSQDRNFTPHYRSPGFSQHRRGSLGEKMNEAKDSLRSSAVPTCQGSNSLSNRCHAQHGQRSIATTASLW